jgi:hypothetical protein
LQTLLHVFFLRFGLYATRPGKLLGLGRLGLQLGDLVD